MAGLNSTNLRVPKTIKLFIGGEFPRTESGRSIPVYASQDKSLFAHLCRASRKDLRNAVVAAKAATSSWEKKTAYNRSQILYRMAEMAEGKRHEFADTLETVQGYSAQKSADAIDQMIDAFVYYAGFADKYPQLIGTINPVAGPHHNFTTPEAVGVVGVLFDGELNLGNLVAQISAIICSGNTVVALLPEDGAAVLAPLSEVFATSDLTKGVVNLLSGHRDELWQQFGSHMEIQSLYYSGTDAKILAELKVLACENMKRIVYTSNLQAHAQANVQAPALSLEQILNFVEHKTVWHPSGF